MMEIPNFLTEMSKQLNEQGNRCTADPLFMVCYDKWLTCADDRGDKIIFLVNDDSEYYEYDHFEEVVNHLAEHYEEWTANQCKGEEVKGLGEILDDSNFDYCDLPANFEIEKLAMQKTMEVVKACLTEADANAFIARKQHDYSKLYTYVFSMVFCPQMIELRNWIKSLTDEDKKAK